MNVPHQCTEGIGNCRRGKVPVRCEELRGLHGGEKGNEGSVWCRIAEKNCLCEVLL